MSQKFSSKLDKYH